LPSGESDFGRDFDAVLPLVPSSLLANQLSGEGLGVATGINC